jgi:hypothetical protein
MESRSLSNSLNGVIMKNIWIVITSINQPTKAIKVISKLCKNSKFRAVVVGDLKTPKEWHQDNIDFLSVDEQKKLFPKLSQLLPYNHYARKNLGYLYAMQNGAECILETDDDNLPYGSFGNELNLEVNANLVSGAKWINIYSYFTKGIIWPRGLPLDEINSIGYINKVSEKFDLPIKQFLADADPDVDAIYRLIFKDEIFFNERGPIAIDQNCWVPFNSQNTLFHKFAFPLLYLPSNVSFRMTDIWRSFVAQQIIWLYGKNVGFFSPTVKQVRNEHSLIKDFNDEIIGYVENKNIISKIEKFSKNFKELKKLPEMTEILYSFWLELYNNNLIPTEEMEIIQEWNIQCNKISEKS